MFFNKNVFKKYSLIEMFLKTLLNYNFFKQWDLILISKKQFQFDLFPILNGYLTTSAFQNGSKSLANDRKINLISIIKSNLKAN